ncbi:MAG: nucleotide sugar dehydrogenase [Humidesulfovibrio sp.]|nr:nucleotide sugar dehydrogenase [Humidesulfovibrio sp.]
MVHFEELINRTKSIAVVGLGYVGLPLALALSKHFYVIGFDIATKRIEDLKQGIDHTGEADISELKCSAITFTDDPGSICNASVIIVAVPTPIDEHRKPDLRPIIGATRTVGRNMPVGAVIVYESTVYPGLTEEVCLPLLEECSGLFCGKDFSIGYSPERINPGDKVHTLQTIVKVVSGLNEATCSLLEKIYKTIVIAGVYCASSIKVAEAAKVIENTQRDINIALMNELSLIFDLMDIDTLEVLKAAGTKWNFLPFRPGLVGGHCIGVDPYYLTFKAEALGHHPQVILAGRRINDSMGKYIASTAVKMLIKAKCPIHEARVGVLGITFKEDVPDLRNTRVVDIISELMEYCPHVLIHDPRAGEEECLNEYGLTLSPLESFRDLDAVILAVPHAEYIAFTLGTIKSWYRNGEAPFLDIKGAMSLEGAEKVGLTYWRL